MGPTGQHLSHYVLATVSEFIASYDFDRGFRFDNDDGNAGCEVAWVNIERHVRNCAGFSVDVQELDCEMWLRQTLTARPDSSQRLAREGRVGASGRPLQSSTGTVI